jgi:hypothetical protein
MLNKSNCELCKKYKIIWEVDKDERRIKACSECITTQHLTGWSK